MKIAILTGGGDCPGLNAVIRAVVRAATRLGWVVLGVEDGFEGLILPNKIRTMTPWNTRGILHIGGTILGTTNRGNPFDYRTIENGKVIARDMSRTVLETLRAYEIEALIVVGGDGSLSIAQRLYEMGVALVGVPKTIDNDLSATDVTFGFDTAVNTAMEALDKLHSTAESHHRAMVLEVMGRNAGWIAIEAGLAGSADVILIPEIPFKIEKVIEKIEERNKKGYKFSIIVVAEGAKPEGGEVSTVKYRLGVLDAYERLGGIGSKVGKAIEERLDVEVRVTVLGHIQRGGSPTAFDRILATRFGTEAVTLIEQKRFGEMVCLGGGEIKTVPIKEAIGRLRIVSPDGQLVTSAESIGISFGR